MGAVNRPEPALWITLVAIPVNALLAYALIYGAFGLPRARSARRRLATTIVNLGMCMAGVLGLLRAAAVQEISACSAASGAGLAADAAS